MTDAPKLQPLTLGEHYRLRPGTEADHTLVRDSWRRSYSGPWSDFALSPSMGAFMRSQKRAIEMALASSALLVACAPDDEGQVLGWICHRPDVLHYLFAKEIARRAQLAAVGIDGSIGRALFEAAFRPGDRIYATSVHTATLRTKLVPRKRSDGDGWRFDREHPVPVWSMYGRRIHFNPFLLLDEGGST